MCVSPATTAVEGYQPGGAADETIVLLEGRLAELERLLTSGDWQQLSMQSLLAGACCVEAVVYEQMTDDVHVCDHDVVNPASLCEIRLALMELSLQPRLLLSQAFWA